MSAAQARSIGRLAEGVLRKGESLDDVWRHIEECLLAVAEEDKPELLKLNEDKLTQRLTSELNCRSGYYPYCFQREYIPDERAGRSRREDLVAQVRDSASFYIDGVLYERRQRFLALEAKRLPTPGTGREKEYLVGDRKKDDEKCRGGIERFKLGFHGPGLRTVGMIGYVQKHTFEHWHKTINGWVDQLIAASTPTPFWEPQDKLDLEHQSPRLAWLRSNNLRVKDNQRLTMRHLWVRLARDATPAAGGDDTSPT